MITILGRLMRHAFAPLRQPALNDAVLQRLSEAVADVVLREADAPGRGGARE